MSDSIKLNHTATVQYSGFMIVVRYNAPENYFSYSIYNEEARIETEDDFYSADSAIEAAKYSIDIMMPDRVYATFEDAIAAQYSREDVRYSSYSKSVDAAGNETYLMSDELFQEITGK